MDWNYFKYIEAVVGTGKVSEAAKLLGIEPAALTKTLHKIEKEYGTKIFRAKAKEKEGGDALIPTREGRELVARAVEIKSLVDSIATARESTRRITVSAVESFFTDYLLPRIPQFSFPLEFIQEGAAVRSDRPIDVALRFGKLDAESSVVKEIFQAGFAPYVARENNLDLSRSLAHVPWAVVTSEYEHLEDFRWLRAEWGDIPVLYRASSYAQVRQLVHGGFCAGLLPCYVGDPDSRLVRHGAKKPVFAKSAWMITHPDAVAHPHIRKFKDWLTSQLEKDRKTLAGML